MSQGLKAMAFAAAMAGAMMVKMAAAQEVLPPEPGIEAVIEDQMQAFLEDDFAQAFRYASPSIQGMFGTPDRFGAMVRNGYPMVWRPEDVEFGALRAVPGGLSQEVIVTDGAGQIHYLAYRMTQLDGAWRIAGVRIVEAPGLNA